jgi:hydroxymethylpyrimidine pyrophosphatase-like HAD family hydrolase
MESGHPEDSSGGRRAVTRRSSRYLAQLALLEETYAQTRSSDLSIVAAALDAMRRRQGIYVGSGGARAVAQLAAEVHERQTRMLARAATPLEVVASPPLFDAGLMLFTASGRHPDATATVEAARRTHARPIFVVTHRTREDLPDAISGPDVEVVTLPSVVEKEGFLATNSVLAMAAAVVAGSCARLPARLPHLRTNGTRALRENTMILYGPGALGVATDLETRLAETGLSSAQVTDYRNFAHGRHTGLARRLDSTTIVALVTPEFVGLADQTLGVLPSRADVIRVESRLVWPFNVLDLLVASMKIIAATAEETDLDPSRPSVPAFGRRLYHLSSRRYLRPQADPIERKMIAARAQPNQRIRGLFEEALDIWSAELRETRFSGVVLDYDGTVCTTARRFELPDAHVRALLLQLLEQGTVIGFASGRGGSLHRDLRQWLPRGYWDQVELGLYNGGLALSLTESIMSSRAQSPLISEVMRRLRVLPISSLLRLEQREHQLSIEFNDGSLSTDVVVGAVLEVLAWSPPLDFKVVASAHSVDVIPAESAKTATLTRVAARSGGEVLAVGDQGQIGGNDFELLAGTGFSLSVDRVSGDPTRCWNLDRRGERGPVLLQRYLGSLRAMRGGLGFRWKG